MTGTISKFVRRRRPPPLLAALAVTLATLSGLPAVAAEQVLVEFGSPITYLANASDPGIAMSWAAADYPDQTWNVGSYGIGYDTAGSAQNLLDTTVPPGTVSVYTRATFTIGDPLSLTSLWLGSDHDDGIVAWINGTEVFRSSEMPPSGPLQWNTPPAAPGEASNGATPDYTPYFDLSSAIPLLNPGDNVLAVGVWNTSAASSDLVLVPQLVADKSLQLVRGPYLQTGTPTSVRVRWRTDVLEDSVVLYGTDPGNLTSSAADPASSLEHEIELTGLQPATQYYYAIGNSSQILAGGDASYFFVTAPAPGTPAPTRIWVLGDSGSAGATLVRDGYDLATGAEHTDLWLMLGDNAYPGGTDLDYQLRLFEVFPEMLRKSVLWPTIGNHDVVNGDSSSATAPYFDVFSLPTQGEAGGLASGTEAYYSFDFANIHFVVLDSHGTDRSAPPAGAMLTWLQNDLAATDQEWILAYWHHPPYSDGSHNSDTELRLIEMRQNAVPILESFGVDLVLAGHSHSYERSFLIDQHYGSSDTFGPQHVMDGGSGRTDEPDGPYIKSFGSVPHEGAVYTVAGTSSAIIPGPLMHPAMFVSWEVLGSVVLEVHGNRLDLAFVDTTGGTLDYFTLVKGSYCTGPDVDHDGACDGDDNCPADYNPGQEDADGDGNGDACDPCPEDADDDIDADAICANLDNCPTDPNPGQEDADGDAIGDVCDACPSDPDNDGDGDTVCGDIDNCPDDANANQADGDGDTIGDVCDACPSDPNNDGDGDTVCGDIDNCPGLPNGSQADSDADTFGDPCDPCPLDAGNDGDGDGICGNVDNCPGVFNDQSDADSDGAGDLCDPCPLDADNDFDQDGHCGDVDNCPGAANADQTDTDSDGIGDACDFPDDADGDSAPDSTDNCPAVSNPAQQDADGNGVGDACDGDDDGDGVPDGQDCAPLASGVSALPGPVGSTLRIEKGGGVTLQWQRAVQGHVSHVYLAIPTPGAPLSGVLTCIDFGNPGTESVHDDQPLPGQLFVYLIGGANICGEGSLGQDTAGNSRNATGACPLDGNDTDGDGTGDLSDNCPQTADPSLSDVDGDFVGDVCDNCPTVLNPQQEDGNADGQGDACADLVDQDLDGIEDVVDNCPTDPNTTQDDSDLDGAGDVCDVCPNDAEDDGDGDGLCADVDNCPTVPNANQTNTDGDLQGDACDTDDDNDGVDDALDSAPLDPFVCRDADTDTCDDCSSGTDDPTDDGTDTDSDGACNAGDEDDDNDGVKDTVDPAPLDPDVCGDSDADTCDDCSVGTDDFGPLSDTLPGNDGDDFEGDGLCDAGDPDDDNDGVEDELDSDPFNRFVCRDADLDTCDDCSSGSDDPQHDGPDNEADGLCDPGDPDDDNDGILDAFDNCSLAANPDQADEDGDEIGDVCDPCLGDPFNDGDGDGRCTFADNCPSVPNPSQADANGDGIGDQCEIVEVAGLVQMLATEVTNAQYVEFLNAVADSDPNGLYNPSMTGSLRGGIIRFGMGGSFSYIAKPNMGNKPVNFVSWLDAARFANWIHNGKPNGAQGPRTTETGAYDLTVPDPGVNAVRQPGATWFLPTKSEWDTAAYDDQDSAMLWLYPTRSDDVPNEATATSNGNVANPGLNTANYNDSADWNFTNGNVTSVAGCGPLSASYWGTYDQGGNVAEWVETAVPGGERKIRGGSFKNPEEMLRRTADESLGAKTERAGLGFRIAGEI